MDLQHQISFFLLLLSKSRKKTCLISRLLLLYIIIHLTFKTYILYNHYLLLCAKFICYLNKCQIWDLVKPLASVTITVNSGVYSDSVREAYISLILTIQPLKFHRVYLFLCYEKRITTSLDHSLFLYSFTVSPFIYLLSKKLSSQEHISGLLEIFTALL